MLLTDFIRSESGAVTTDYVVLSAAMVGSGLAAVNSSAVGVENIAGDIVGFGGCHLAADIGTQTDAEVGPIVLADRALAGNVRSPARCSR